ncbi:protein OS-9-like isoform X2 [Palaemon carinicauda]|uniref:protein OS-9-like isoform X2 n=1 Tax=Palaemon carinicauda TaxID=392227 RepID=UPI0035B655AF
MMWPRVFPFLCVLFIVTESLNTVLNLDEINSIHYAIDILNKPVIKDQVYEGDVMTVINKYGQEYICSLPKIAPSDADAKSEENILDQLVDISGLLKPMETAPCLIKTVDWWTYEFCYGSVIKQYHLEDNKASGPILILGKYESEYNWKNSSETKNRLQRFHSQFYVNGTKCDVTGQPRRTEVRFHCEDGVGDYIQRVDEPESCRYVVTVATTRVCHHPYLRLQTVRTPHAITCAPALTEDQYNRYLTYQDKKAKEEESLKEKWLKKNAEILGEADHQESQSILKPIVIDEDDELKMNIKIFKLAPLKKNKNSQSAEMRDVMEVETQITLEENDPQLKVEDLKLSTETERSADSLENNQNILNNADDIMEASDSDGDLENMIDDSEVIGKDGEELISDAQTQDLLHLLDSEDSYLKEGDELEEIGDDDEDGEDDEDEIEDEDEQMMETVPQASKSTNKDHFFNLHQKLKQLGEKFLKPEERREVDDGMIEEINHMVNNMKEGQIKQLEKEVKEWTRKMMSKDVDHDMDDEELEEEEQKFETAFSSFMDALDKAENKLSSAKKEMETLEKLLDNQLKEMEILKLFENENSDTEDPSKGDVDGDSLEAQEKIAETVQDDEDHSSKSPKKKADDLRMKNRYQPLHNWRLKNRFRPRRRLGVTNTKQLRIMKNKLDDESQKSKLEQTIKDRLQKLGLEKISKKFEVKILTPNSLEDEDTSNPLLSQEETEAFQNMIVNLLSANAEELEERENHRKLEKNYGFKWDDSHFADDEEE